MRPDLDSAAAERVAAALEPQPSLLDDAFELLGVPETQKVAAVRRAGRPAGARNRRFEDTARAVIERFGDPLLRQVAVATMDLRALMALGLDVKDALAEQRLAAAVVMPYLHQRQAIAVDVTHQRTLNLTIETGLGQVAEAAPAEIVGFVINQEVREAADGDV